MTSQDRVIQAERLRRLRMAESLAVLPKAEPAPEPVPVRKVPLAVPVEPKVKK